jgi:hypothetical protein
MEADSFAKKRYDKALEALQQSYKIAGVLDFNGKVMPGIFSSIEELKLVTKSELLGNPKLIYAGKIKFKNGKYDSLEEIDISKLDL